MSLSHGIGCAQVYFSRSSALNQDRFAAAALWVLGAWLMAMAQVYLWRQGKLMAHCSVLLDNHGAHFKLGNSAER